MGPLRAFVFLALAWGTTVASGQAATLRDAMLAALTNNPGLAAARERIRGAEAQLDAARAGQRPTVSLNSSEGISYLDTDDEATTLGATRQALVVRQPLLSGGEVRGDIARTRAALAAEKARLEETEQVILLQTVQAYAAMVRDRGLLALSQGQAARLRQDYDQTRARFRFGDVTTTDIAQAETRVAGAADDVVGAEAALAGSIADYERIVGETPPPSMAGPQEARRLPRSLAEAQGLAHDHPSLASATSDVETARGALTVARSSRRPKVALEGQFGYATDPDRYTGHQTEASVGAVVTVPLYQGGGAAARERAAQSELAQRRYDLDDRELDVIRQVTQAWQGLNAARSSIHALEVQVRSAGIAADGVRQEALIGLRTVLDILDAENELFAARAQLVRARSSETVASYALLAAVGELTERRQGLLGETEDDPSMRAVARPRQP